MHDELSEPTTKPATETLFRRWVYQRCILWALVAIVGYWLYTRWDLGHGHDMATDMALVLLIVLFGGYVIVSRAIMFSCAKDARTRWHRLAELVATPVLIALWFFIGPVLVHAGFERNVSRAISLGLVQDCERLVAAVPAGEETSLSASERPESIRAIKPFRVIVSPPTVRLLITTGLDNKRWMVIDPAEAKGGESSEEHHRSREIAKGIYF